ncbi:hypothetical protein CBW18_19775 [Pedobacter sp. AJM]|nr:hypothetical protein CBW18_19775 [Pedobacter sp. AJM]
MQLFAAAAFAQTLGEASGNFVEIKSTSGFTHNNFMNKQWLKRKSNGSDWLSTTLVDGIGVDGSFLTPGVDSKTWWERDPATGNQTWGTGNTVQLTLNGPIPGVPNPTLEINSQDNGWLMSTRGRAFSTGNINGIKFYSGYEDDYEKWSGIASVAEDIYSNHTGLTLYSNKTEKVRIAANGNVGIGTTNPGEKLSIDSQENGWLISMRGRAHQAGNLNGLKFYSGYEDDFQKWAGIASVAEDVHSNHTALTLYTNQTEKLRVTGNGDVGIGTISPKEKLSVNGKIRAHEVKVEITNWPDYVFEKGYKPPSLAALENYISKNKHLPEIPSEDEVAEKGIELGDMNRLLLKKIEEMTIYLIEMKKENNKQQNQIDALKKRLIN